MRFSQTHGRHVKILGIFCKCRIFGKMFCVVLQVLPVGLHAGLFHTHKTCLRFDTADGANHHLSAFLHCN